MKGYYPFSPVPFVLIAFLEFPFVFYCTCSIFCRFKQGLFTWHHGTFKAKYSMLHKPNGLHERFLFLSPLFLLHLCMYTVCVFLQALLWWHHPPCCHVTMALWPRSNVSLWSATSTLASGVWDHRWVFLACGSQADLPPLSCPPGQCYHYCHVCQDNATAIVMSTRTMLLLLSCLPGQCYYYFHVCQDNATIIVMSARTMLLLLSVLAGQFHHHCHVCQDSFTTIVMPGWTVPPSLCLAGLFHHHCHVC